MTAVNLILERDAAYLFTDAAAVHTSGAFRFLTAKPVILPQFPAIVVARGLHSLSYTLSTTLQALHVSTFDEAVERLGDVMRMTQDALAAYDPAQATIKFDAVLVGWSEAVGKPIARLATSYETPDGTPPFTPIEIEEAYASPLTEEFLGVLDRLRIDATDPHQAVRLMDAQRRHKFPIDPASGATVAFHAAFAVAGGFIQETVLRKDSITTRVLHRWEDTPEEKAAGTIGTNLQ